MYNQFLGFLITLLATVLCSSCLQRAEACAQTNVSANLTCSEDANCPPWAECKESRCVCREELKQNNAIICNKETLQLSVIRCHCVTFEPETNSLFEGSCIETYKKFQNIDPLQLPIEISKLNEVVCEERSKRTGRLCGKCLPGYSPLAYSYDMRCVKCPDGNKNVWKYILIAFGPLTVFYFLILFLKINITSSHLHGYVIFCQIIASPSFVRDVVIYNQYHPQTAPLIQAVSVLYTVWNLDFFRGLVDVCLDMSTLSVLALDYAVGFYPLLLTVVSYLLIELHSRNVRIVVVLWKPFQHLFLLVRRNWDSRNTVIDAYTTFFVLSYVKLMCVSVYLLIPVRVYILGSKKAKWALYYDATVDYFGREHLPYAILAITYVIIAMVPTLSLLLYPFSCFQRILGCLKIPGHIVAALMDSFHGSYKNGTEPGTRDCRWFAGIPLVGRWLLLITWAATIDDSTFPLLITIITCIIVLTANIQPYKSHLIKYARIDITFWGFLALFYAFGDAATYSSLNPRLFTEVVNVLQVIAGVSPLIYMICITAYYLLSSMRRAKTLITQFKAWRRGYQNIDFPETLPHRMVSPDYYVDLHKQ